MLQLGVEATPATVETVRQILHTFIKHKDSPNQVARLGTEPRQGRLYIVPERHHRGIRSQGLRGIEGFPALVIVSVHPPFETAEVPDGESPS